MANFDLSGTDSQSVNDARKDLQVAFTDLKPAYNALTNPQKSAALTALVNWNANAPAPTVARENALYVAVVFLTVVVGYIALLLKDRLR